MVLLESVAVACGGAELGGFIDGSVWGECWMGQVVVVKPWCVCVHIVVVQRFLIQEYLDFNIIYF